MLPKSKSVAGLNRTLIDRCVTGFPSYPLWQKLLLRTTANGKISWTEHKHLAGVGGVYGFLLARKHIRSPKSIDLPRSKGRAVRFRFAASDFACLAGDQFVAYVGKSADLLSRFQQHLHKSERGMAIQVQRELVKSRICLSSPIMFILRQASIVYAILPGDENAPNRDIIEVTLCGRYMPPFNIKAEK